MLLFDWLLEGDVSIRYMVHRDLLVHAPQVQIRLLQRRLGLEGWAARLLEHYDEKTGMWGGGWYSPKWISTHYSLRSLKDLCIPPEHPVFRKAVADLIETQWENQPAERKNVSPDHSRPGGRKSRPLDLCVAAMMLDVQAYSGKDSPASRAIIDYILHTRYSDGGFNCNWDRGDSHSSLHSTLSVLEAFQMYQSLESGYRKEEIASAIASGEEFILKKRLFRSQTSGEVIDPAMLLLSFPVRWKYDILRALEYFARHGRPYDPRMEEALNVLVDKQRADGRWNNQGRYPGKVFFHMEEAGKPSRMNTYRVLYVLKAYRPEYYDTIFKEDYDF
ncbi:hypothetical protein [Salinispira pacifica]|uniref:Squalene cyclase C-terminal domain-containing protein n=1 Tax=Salinispira pacifica TaxID=1307761 RepID=V5WL41_9SPIO|nr:hypothetical protein [Salinispira pacifica]AHC15911.1 hypothetical protein L21SP2_2559 [Salinispira pacifica]